MGLILRIAAKTGQWDDDEELTLRDLFAAHALASGYRHLGNVSATPEEVAWDAYRVADAMLAMRKEPSE